MEEWRNISGWEGLYQVSNLGRVRSLPGFYNALRKGTPAQVSKPGRVLKPYLAVGYPMITLCREGEETKMYIHRLVCEAWHGMPKSGEEVAHNDGTRMNNDPRNLRWVSRLENNLDKVRHCTQKRHEQLWFTKIPEAIVEIIRFDRTKTSKQWANELGVSRSLIGMIRQGTRRSKPSLKKAA